MALSLKLKGREKTPVRFSQDWFSAHRDSWEHILEGFRGNPDVKALEVGCFEGRTTRWLLENVLTGAGSGITVVDTFKGDPLLWADVRRDRGRKHAALLRRDLEKRFVRNVVRDFPDRVKVEKGRSASILLRYGQDQDRLFSFDFAYVDGSHKADNVFVDGRLTWPLLKRNGILIFDDYGAFWKETDPRQPKRGIDRFLADFRGRYEELSVEGNYQMILRKRS